MNQLTNGGIEKQIALLRQSHLVCPINAQFDFAGVSTRRYDQVILNLLLFPVIDKIDTRVKGAVLDAGMIGDTGNVLP